MATNKLRVIVIDGEKFYFICDLAKSFGISQNSMSNFARVTLNREELRTIWKKDLPVNPDLICHRYLVTDQAGLKILEESLRNRWIKQADKAGLMDIQRLTARPYLKKYLSHSVASNSSSQQSQQEI